MRVRACLDQVSDAVFGSKKAGQHPRSRFASGDIRQVAVTNLSYTTARAGGRVVRGRADPELAGALRQNVSHRRDGTGCDRNHRELCRAAAKLAVPSTSGVLEDEQVSSALSQIASAVAGLALVTTGLIVFPENYTRSLAKGLAVSVSLAILAAVLISVARNLGS